jgi:hypothetical protein
VSTLQSDFFPFREDASKNEVYKNEQGVQELALLTICGFGIQSSSSHGPSLTYHFPLWAIHFHSRRLHFHSHSFLICLVLSLRPSLSKLYLQPLNTSLVIIQIGISLLWWYIGGWNVLRWYMRRWCIRAWIHWIGIRRLEESPFRSPYR